MWNRVSLCTKNISINYSEDRSSFSLNNLKNADKQNPHRKNPKSPTLIKLKCHSELVWTPLIAKYVLFMAVHLELTIGLFKQTWTEFKLLYIVANVLLAELSTIFLNVDKILLNVLHKSIHFTSLRKKPHKEIFGRLHFVCMKLLDTPFPSGVKLVLQH